jgi:hypothetical protein
MTPYSWLYGHTHEPNEIHHRCTSFMLDTLCCCSSQHMLALDVTRSVLLKMREDWLLFGVLNTTKNLAPYSQAWMMVGYQECYKKQSKVASYGDLAAPAISLRDGCDREEQTVWSASEWTVSLAAT